MIRREADGHYLLITQDEHAKLAGRLATRLGNARFQAMQANGPALTAVAMHDAGWPLHDGQPTINSDHLPSDVFETSPAVAMKVWPASAERAAVVHPYAGLLVSLHSLSLSALATQQVKSSSTNEKFTISGPHELFAINKFQHREIERQEQLRKILGMRTDIPLTFGLADSGVDPREDQLAFDFHLLQAMDLMSLCLCCTKPPASQTSQVLARPGAAPVHLTLTICSPARLAVAPWPFNVSAIESAVPCRRVPNRQYESDTELRAVYAAAENETLHLQLVDR